MICISRTLSPLLLSTGLRFRTDTYFLFVRKETLQCLTTYIMNKLLHFWSSCTVFQLYEKSQAQLLKDLQVRLWFLIIREQKSLQVNHPLYHICIQVTADYSFVIIYPTELTNQYISAHKHYKFIGFSYVYLSWSLIPHAAFTYQKLDFDLKIRI